MKPLYTVNTSRAGVGRGVDANNVTQVKRIVGDLMAEAWVNGYKDVNITISKNR